MFSRTHFTGPPAKTGGGSTGLGVLRRKTGLGRWSI
jgi:hypothetical protein